MEPDRMDLTTVTNERRPGASRQTSSVAAHRGGRLPVAGGCECAATLRRRALHIGFVAGYLTRGQRAGSIVHQPLDSHQDVGPLAVENWWPLWRFGVRVLRLRCAISRHGRRRAQAWDRLELDALVRVGHDVVP